MGAMKEFFQECDDMLQKYEDKVQEQQEEIEDLKNEIDVKWMQYLSQVSMWKSRYEEAKTRLDEKNEQFLDYLERKSEESYEAYSESFRNKKPQEIQEIYRKQAGVYNKDFICETWRQSYEKGEITAETYNKVVSQKIKDYPLLWSESDLIKKDEKDF